MFSLKFGKPGARLPKDYQRLHGELIKCCAVMDPREKGKFFQSKICGDETERTYESIGKITRTLDNILYCP